MVNIYANMKIQKKLVNLLMNDAIETLQEPSLSADDDADLPF